MEPILPYLYDGWGNMPQIVIAAALIYASIVLFIRISGKRSTSQMNNFDWIVTVAIGSMVGTGVLPVVVTVAECLVGVGTLMLLQWLVTHGVRKSTLLCRAVKAPPTVLVCNGEIQEQAMRDERINREEVFSAMRENGLLRLEDVRFLVLEADAGFSVIRQDAVDNSSEVETAAANPYK